MNITSIFTKANSNTSGISLGYGNFIIEDSIIINFSIMRNMKDGKIYVSWPKRDSVNSEGKKEYYPQVLFTENSKELKAEIEEAILESFSSKIQTKQPTSAFKHNIKKTYMQKNEESEPAPSIPFDSDDKPKRQLWSKPTP